MEQVNVTIDGMQVKGTPGSTILEVAEKAGIHIPTLCHQEGLKPSGNCRVCVVEVEGSRALVGSCHTPVTNGMVVRTTSQRVLDARRATIELLLTAHTGPCVNDTEARECGLHKLASDLEVGPPRFSVRKPRLYRTEESPYVLRDMSRCILCRKCVRACREVAGQEVYAVAYRGFDSKVVVDLDIPLNKEVCKDCGICIDYCPTSALMWPGAVKKRPGPGKKRKVRRPAGSPTQEGLLDRLKAEQRTNGFVTEAAMRQLSEDLRVPLSEVYGVASFYRFLSPGPQGKHVIRICKSLPCHLKDAPMIIKAVEQAIGIKPGETTPDGRFSFELANCIGACDEAPAMLIDDTVYGHLTPRKIAEVLTSHRTIERRMP